MFAIKAEVSDSRAKAFAFSKFRIALLLAFGSIVLVLVVNFFVLLVAYECWAFGKAIISRRVPHPVQVCTYDGRFHWH